MVCSLKKEANVSVCVEEEEEKKRGGLRFKMNRINKYVVNNVDITLRSLQPTFILIISGKVAAQEIANGILGFLGGHGDSFTFGFTFTVSLYRCTIVVASIVTVFVVC